MLKYLKKKTKGRNACWWAAFRHPLLAGKRVACSTSISVDNIVAADVFSKQLAHCIQGRLGWADRINAIAKHGHAARLYYETAATRSLDGILDPDFKVPLTLAALEEFMRQDDALHDQYEGEELERHRAAIRTQHGLTVDAIRGIGIRDELHADLITATAERDSAQQEATLAQKRIRELEQKVIDATGDKGQPLPYEKLAKDYLDHLKAKGGRGGKAVSPVHYRQRERHLLEFWMPRLQLTDLREIQMPVIDDVLTKLLSGEEIKYSGPNKRRTGDTKASTKTIATLAESIIAFCAWCDKMGHRRNPLEHLQSPSRENTNKRGGLNKDQLNALFKAAPERALLYEVAAKSGFRKGELAALLVQDFSSENCSLTLDARFTKNRKSCRKFLSIDLTNRLAASIKGKNSDDRLLMFSPNIDRFFKRDLVKAGIKEREGHSLAFHSLRHSTSALLSKAGASVREQMDGMRHSTPQLSIVTYQDEPEVARQRELAEKVDEVLRG